MEFKFSDFKGNELLMKPIMEEANFNQNSGFYEWNNSTILTELIHAAGRWCERFASDLFIDWMQVESDIQYGYENDLSENCYLFGFRKDGVDHTAYIFNRAKESSIYRIEDFYRALYKLTVIESKEFSNMKIILERVL